MRKAAGELYNFTPQIEKHIIRKGGNGGETVDVLVLRLKFKDGSRSDVMEIKLADIRNLDWFKLDTRCRFDPDITPAKIKRYLFNDVQKAMMSAPQEEQYLLNHMGAFKIESSLVFCVGKEVIQSGKNQRKFVSSVVGQRMDTDENLSTGEALSMLLDCISLCPKPGTIMIAYQIVWIMRQAFEDAGSPPQFCIFLFGQSGTMKTTMASFLTQLYNRGDGIESPTRLNASLPAACEIIRKHHDDVAVLDDLYPADSSRIRSNQEEIMKQVTRYIADGVFPERMKGGKVSEGRPRCGVIFTGEYMIGTGSTAARMLSVEMTKPDGERLNYYQKHPLFVSTFYKYFIEWFVENYDDVVNLVQQWLKQYRSIDMKVHGRLQEIHMCLNVAYSVLLQYAYEIEFITDEEAQKLHGAFLKYIHELVLKQNERVKQESHQSYEPIDYLARIKKAYASQELSIAKTVADFDEKHHEGVLHDGALFLRQDCLARLFSGENVTSVIKELYCQGALNVNERSKNKTKQISALNGMRFYSIPMEKIV